MPTPEPVDERTERDIARLVYQAGEIGVNAFLFAGLKEGGTETLLHIQHMKFDQSFNASLILMKHLVKTHLEQNTAFSDEYRSFFEAFVNDMDSCVAGLSMKIAKMNKRVQEKLAKKK